MPSRKINLTQAMEKAVADKIKNGRYANASEVILAGLRALEEDEREQAAKLSHLRTALHEGESGTAEDGVFDRVLTFLAKTPDVDITVD